MGIPKRHTAVRLLSVLLASGVLLFLAVGCKQAAPADGTITVKLTGAATQNTEIFRFGIYQEGADHETGTVYGKGAAPVVSGEAQYTAFDATLTHEMIFSGGGRYFVFAWIDASDEGVADPGEYAYQAPAFTVNGNMTQTLYYSNFTQLP